MALGTVSPLRKIEQMTQQSRAKTLDITHFRISKDRDGGHEKALRDLSKTFYGVAKTAEKLDVFPI